MNKNNWASFGCNLYGSSREIQFQSKTVSHFQSLTLFIPAHLKIDFGPVPGPNGWVHAPGQKMKNVPKTGFIG
jgi:hypothetical protein